MSLKKKSKQKKQLKTKAELDKLNNEWKNQAAILSEQARLQKQQEFQQKFIALRNEEMTFQKEIKEKSRLRHKKSQ